MEENILEVKRLKVSFRTNNGTVKAVRDISFGLKKGKTLAIVGESGSGKSVTSKVIMGISAGNAIIEGGQVLYDGKDIVKINEDEMYDIRGDKIAMIFQDPLSSLNPIVRIGKQITEAMILKNRAKIKRSRKEFNTKLHILQQRMIAVYADDPKVTEQDIREMIKEFNAFNVVGLKLENSYNDNASKVDILLADVENMLYLANKKRKVNLGAKLVAFSTTLKQLNDIYFTNGFNREIEERIEDIASLSTTITNKPEFLSEKIIEELTSFKAFLERMHAQDKPDFFRFGYFVRHDDPEKLLKLPVEDANAMALKFLDENFMNKFIELCRKAVQSSYDEAFEGKQKAISFLEEAKKVYSEPELDNAKCKTVLDAAAPVIEASIDRLAPTKDTIAYTFANSLRYFTRKYFTSSVLNAKENERFEKENKKRQQIIASGKQVDWKVIPAKTIDLEDIRNDINDLIDALLNKYKNIVTNENEPLVDDLVVAIIDKFKQNASDVVYKISKKMAKEKAIKLMEEVGIPEARLRFKQYPFEFSGGMRQRIVIAIALSANPEILICDEPTTALDVTIQSQILELINKLKRERGLSIIFITHDLGVVANMADDIAVMYAGKIVEYGSCNDIFYDPRHPYTWALLSSMPDLDTKEKLEAIPGTPPNMIYPPKGDAFAARNKYALKIDFEEQPPMFKVSDTHYAATWLLDPRSPKVEKPSVITERIKRMREKNGGKE